MIPNQAQRVIAHVDLDAFYTQVEVQRNPQLKGLPVVTVQYNPFGDLRTITPDEPRIFNDSNGSLIAVSYEARAAGVKRGMRGDQARKACPNVQLVQVPTAHGKADLTLYRDAGKLVVDILSRIAICERASIDECYLDLTEEAHSRLAAFNGHPPLPVNADRVHICGQEGVAAVTDWWQRPPELWQAGELLLACGATAVADLRAAVAAELGYSCSAGIAHNKILAKLASGMHKPSQQTLVPLAAVPGLLQDLPISKLRQLGGKFGDELMASLNIKTVGELAEISLQTLESQHGDSTAQWLYRLARGCDTEEVKQRTLPKSISCGKTFRNHTALHTITDVHHWLSELAKELDERVTEDRKANARLPQLLTVSVYSPPQGADPKQASWPGGSSVSRSCQLRKATAACMADDATALVKKWTIGQKDWSICSMFLAVSNFAAAPTGSSLITKFFKQPPAPVPTAPVQVPQSHQPSTAAQWPQSQQPSAPLQEVQLQQVSSVSVEHAQPGAQSSSSMQPLQSQQGQPVSAEHAQHRQQSLVSVQAPQSQQMLSLSGEHARHEQQSLASVQELQSQVLPVSDQHAQLAQQSLATVQASEQRSDPGGQLTPGKQSNLVQVALHSTGHQSASEEAQHRNADAGEQPVASAGPVQSPDELQQQPLGIHEGFAADVQQDDAAVQQVSAAAVGLGSRVVEGQHKLPHAAGKRPLDQDVSKERDHRKRPNRTLSTGVDAPLYGDYSNDTIDQNVLNELPASMQREIRISMMAQRSARSRHLTKSAQPAGRAGMHKFFKPRT